jgi:DNA replication regulator SLD3
MLESTSKSPVPILGLSATHHEPNPQLPTQRSRGALSGPGYFTKPFTIRPYSGSPHQRAVTFKPVRVIQRYQLPLAFFDTSAEERFPPNCLFSAHIDVLEDHDGTQEKGYQPPHVLVAQEESSRLLYAIERVRTRMYSLCRLAPSMKEGELEDVRDPLNLAPYPVLSHQGDNVVMGEEWWQHTIVHTQPLAQLTRRVRVSMMRPKPETEVITGPIGSLEEKLPVYNLLDAQPLDHVLELPSPQEQLDTLAQQYLDAVYMSKTSLAYFAKGPIARIRSAFTSPAEGAPPTLELVTFLRSMLLSHKASEKKYHEKLPAIIKSIPPDTLSDDDAGAKVDKVSKSKKKWKISREGVYPQEEGMVKRWWKSSMFAGENVSRETMDQRVKRRVGDLRVRETLAQMILMLEIVALEALSTSKLPLAESLATEGAQAQDESQTTGKKRKKKFEDIGLQLDLLLDKLSIWHATEEDGIMNFEAKASRHNDNSEGPSQDGGSDRLRDFCVEVVIPFYMNRLPEQALMINKKLGGPANTTPHKRKAMRPPVTSRKSGGGKEPDMKKPRRSLARVATDSTGRIGARPARSLSRSATDSTLLRGVKREGSEVPLSTIPFQRSPSRGARQSMSQIRHLQGREMDLTTTSAAVAAKLKQKQRVEEDLKEAITALKKPNRDLAAGSYVAEIEKRGLGSAARARKPTNTVRKAVKDVQVSATPRVGRRTKNMIEQTPRRDDDSPFVGPAPQVSDFNIPSSAVRPTSTALPVTTQRSATGRGEVARGIAETPSKGPSTTMFTLGPARRTIFDTPLKSSLQDLDDEPGALSIFETPSKRNGDVQMGAVSMSPVGVNTTPTKPASVPIAGDGPGSSKDASNENTEASIYDALGWNDDDEFG